MQRAAMNHVASPAERGEAVALFQKESKLLSKAAVGAMAALCVSLVSCWFAEDGVLTWSDRPKRITRLKTRRARL